MKRERIFTIANGMTRLPRRLVKALRHTLDWIGCIRVVAWNDPACSDEPRGLYVEYFELLPAGPNPFTGRHEAAHEVLRDVRLATLTPKELNHFFGGVEVL